MRTLNLRYSGLIIGLALLVSPAAFCENSLTLSVQYDAYTDNESPETSGYELAAPFELTLAGDPFAITVQGAYARAEVSRDGSEDAALEGVTDTFISASYTYLFPGENPTKIILNVDLNLPTGPENLNAEETVAESGQRGDLFRIDDFGEGLNVAATIGVEQQFGASTVGLYGGYTYYGPYDPRSDETGDDYDPGDEIFAGLLYEWQGSPRFTLQTYLGYSYFLADTENDEDTLKIGDKLAAGTDLRAGLLESLDMTLSLQYIMQLKSEEALGGELVEESTNSNGEEVFGSLDLTYYWHPRFDMRLFGEVRYYGESDRRREDMDLPYEGQRVRYAAGSGFELRLTPSIALHGLGAYFYLDSEPNATFAAPGEFQGMNLDMGMTYTF